MNVTQSFDILILTDTGRLVDPHDHAAQIRIQAGNTGITFNVQIGEFITVEKMTWSHFLTMLCPEMLDHWRLLEQGQLQEKP